MNTSGLTTRRQALGLLAGLAGLAPGGVHAAPGGLPSASHADSSPQWERLRKQLFSGREVRAGQSVVQVHTPLRAAYGASVPLKIVSLLPQRPELFVRRMHVIIDKNPSPLAMVLDLTQDLGLANFETRLRVDEYSHVRVVTELSNGELHTDSRYVKTSGGCSAPPNRDAPHLIGTTVFKLPEAVAYDQPNLAELTVRHPNDTGFELNQQTVMYIPPHFVRSVQVSYARRRLFDAEMDFSVSENPSIRFFFVPRSPGELSAEVTDSKDGRFRGALAVGASG